MAEEWSIRPSVRLTALFVPWAIAIGVVVLFNSPVSFSDFWGFPYGLSWFVFPSDWHRPEAVDLAAVVAGWIVLLMLTVVCYRQSRKRRYVSYYAALCFLLGLDIIGWQRFWTEIAPLLKL